MGRKIDIPIEDIVEQWLNGASTRQIGEKYNVSASNIGERLREYKKRTGIKLERVTKTVLPMEEVIQDLRNGISLKEIAKKFNVSEDILYVRRKEYEQEKGITIEELLKQEGISLKEGRRKNVSVEKVIEEYKKRIYRN